MNRVQAIVLLASGVSISDVARQFHCHRNIINNLRQRLRQTGSVKDAVHSGRPKVTTPRQDRYITLTHLRNRFRTDKSTGIQFGISRQTVLNRLRKNADPIRARRPYVGHIIRPRFGCFGLDVIYVGLEPSGQGSCLQMSPVSI